MAARMYPFGLEFQEGGDVNTAGIRESGATAHLNAVNSRQLVIREGTQALQPLRTSAASQRGQHYETQGGRPQSWNEGVDTSWATVDQPPYLDDHGIADREFLDGRFDEPETITQELTLVPRLNRPPGEHMAPPPIVIGGMEIEDRRQYPGTLPKNIPLQGPSVTGTEVAGIHFDPSVPYSRPLSSGDSASSQTQYAPAQLHSVVNGLASGTQHSWIPSGPRKDYIDRTGASTSFPDLMHNASGPASNQLSMTSAQASTRSGRLQTTASSRPSRSSIDSSMTQGWDRFGSVVSEGFSLERYVVARPHPSPSGASDPPIPLDTDVANPPDLGGRSHKGKKFRRLTEEQKTERAEKRRTGVCPTCRKKKVFCTHTKAGRAESAQKAAETQFRRQPKKLAPAMPRSFSETTRPLNIPTNNTGLPDPYHGRVTSGSARSASGLPLLTPSGHGEYSTRNARHGESHRLEAQEQNTAGQGHANGVAQWQSRPGPRQGEHHHTDRSHYSQPSFSSRAGSRRQGGSMQSPGDPHFPESYYPRAPQPLMEQQEFFPGVFGLAAYPDTSGARAFNGSFGIAEGVTGNPSNTSQMVPQDATMRGHGITALIPNLYNQQGSTISRPDQYISDQDRHPRYIPQSSYHPPGVTGYKDQRSP